MECNDEKLFLTLIIKKPITGTRDNDNMIQTYNFRCIVGKVPTYASSYVWLPNGLQIRSYKIGQKLYLLIRLCPTRVTYVLGDNLWNFEWTKKGKRWKNEVFIKGFRKIEWF